MPAQRFQHDNKNQHIDSVDSEQCAIDLRTPAEVMRLERLGSFFPHRLSFMRILMRQLCAERAQIRITDQQLDQNGFGHMVLSLQLGGMDISLIAYSRELDAEDRTDRVIATKWDASFCLFRGVPTPTEIAELATHVTAQEAGRYHEKVLTLSRANKSVRLFEHVVQALAAGKSPERKMINQIGYLMRTTAVYGNGKFGIADRDDITDTAWLQPPFQAEMLTVYLIREFSFLLVEWCAAQKGDQAALLDQATKRNLGIGNSTGLGMAPFLVNHPCLIHSWMSVRETALQRARKLLHFSEQQSLLFSALLERALAHLQCWNVEDAEQTTRNVTLEKELSQFIETIQTSPLAKRYPLNDAFLRVQTASLDMQELMVSLLIEIVPEEVDGLAHCLSNPYHPRIDTAMSVRELQMLMDKHYQWAVEIDLENQDEEAQFWYVSEAKLEPRLGRRFEEEGADREMPFHLVRYIQELQRCIDKQGTALSVAEFLLRYPHTRHIIRRIHTIARFPFGEIRDNLVAKSCRPIDLLRCKLSFFGASHFDPKSDRWTRVTLFQGAPTAQDIATDGKDDWLFASLH